MVSAARRDRFVVPRRECDAPVALWGLAGKQTAVREAERGLGVQFVVWGVWVRSV